MICMMKCIIGTTLTLLLLSAGCSKKGDTDFHIVIASVTEIEPIKELREGFREKMESSEFSKTHKLIFEEVNALGDASLMSQISDNIALEAPDMVYVLGTPLAQMIQKKAPNVLMVQGACTDPVSAGLADSWEGSGRKFIATSDLPPIEKQMELIKELITGNVRLGVIYNPGESNSASVIARIRVYLESKAPGIELIERSIAASSDAVFTVQSLGGQVDALYLPPDNTVHSAIGVILKFAKENNIPVFATTSDALDAGALATLSLDFRQLGRESAELSLQVLAGSNPAMMPIRLSSEPTLRINAAVARELGIKLAEFEKWKNVIIVGESK